MVANYLKNRHFFLFVVLFVLIILLSYIHLQKTSFESTQATPTPYPTSVLPPTLDGPFSVVKVEDGDTIIINMNDSQQTIRFVGIDTPEVQSQYRSAMCFGKEASAKTKELLVNQQVYLELDSDQNQIDKYNRLLRYVYRAGDNLFVSKYLVETGYATEYTYQGVPHKYQAEFRQAQVSARTRHLGLWDNRTCLVPPNPHD